MKKVSIFITVAFLGIFGISQGCTGARCENCGTVVHTTVLEGVNFAFNKADLLPIAHPILDKDVTMLKNDHKLKVRVEGHCDIRGSDEYNQKLSERRATTVYNYFTSKGIDKSRMSTIGYGRSKPLVPNTTEENMYKNRRVEVKIVEPTKS
jgi:outer membrane protein OmpA-like peptidoglycan-associated protein